MEDGGIEPLQKSPVPQLSRLVAVHSAASSKMHQGGTAPPTTQLSAVRVTISASSAKLLYEILH